MRRSFFLALPVLAMAQAAMATQITRPVSLAELGFSVDDARVVEPLPVTPALETGATPPLRVTPNSTLLWNDLLGGRDFNATQINRNTIAIDIPRECARGAHPGGAGGGCTQGRGAQMPPLTRGVSLEELGLDREDFTVIEPLPVVPTAHVPAVRGLSPEDFGLPPDAWLVTDFLPPPPPELTLWDDVLGTADEGFVPGPTGSIPANVPLACGLAANPDGSIPRCFPETTDTASRGGQVPAPGGLLLIAAFLGVVWRRHRYAS